LAWLFLNAKQDDTNRLLTYYQYLIRANKSTIQRLKKTQSDLDIQQQQLNNELQALKQLQGKYQEQQQQLIHYQSQRKQLLAKLSQQIQTQENTLTIYQENRQNLTQILRTLNQQSVIRTRQPMTRMKTKLPLPIQAGETLDIKKINQGIVFYNPEASPVYAVYPGKVVFRDWLNGYGYLMILDHGWGLMTLYANNLSFTKQKGDTVIQGEQIAKVGHSGTLKQSGLYFEVRRYGKAVPPLEWLKHH
jgi:septal ring factor EnvC (AmiA/AmiB activator)